MSHLLFYATREDLLLLVAAVESKVALTYVRTGNFLAAEKESRLEVYDTGTKLPHLGEATAESASYLVCRRDTPIIEREVESPHGRRFCIDQLLNPDTVTLTPAGRCNDDILVYGRVATASDSRPSQQLMKHFKTPIQKLFTKIKAFYVGPGARALWANGCRLTIGVDASRESDLTLD